MIFAFLVLALWAGSPASALAVHRTAVTPEGQTTFLKVARPAGATAAELLQLASDSSANDSDLSNWVIRGCFALAGITFAAISIWVCHGHYNYFSKPVGYRPYTWFAFESRKARESLGRDIHGIVWLTDKRLFALLMHLCPDKYSDSAHKQHRQTEDIMSPADAAVEHAVLAAAKEAGASGEVQERLCKALHGNIESLSADHESDPNVRIVPTFLVQGGGCLALPGVNVSSAIAGLPWFVKNANVDSCWDNHCCATIEECLLKTTCKSRNFDRDERNKAFVIQQHIPRPMLIDGHKFDLRAHVVVVARKGPPADGEDSAKLLQAFLFDEVLVKLAPKPWSQGNIDSRCQHTNSNTHSQSSFHQRLLCNIPRGQEILQNSARAIEACLRRARDMLHHGAQINARQILGVDVIIDENACAWILEFNYLPGDNPRYCNKDNYEKVYFRIKQDLPHLACEPLLQGKPAQALKGWQELHF